MTEPVTDSRKAVRELLELLVRTMKTLSLYDSRNPVTEKLEAELHRRFSALLEAEGAIELTIQQQQILLGEEIVCESLGSEGSLPPLLARDGIRALDFRPGLSETELHSFVSCLNRGRSNEPLDDDLATLLWEEDFDSIGFVVIDELSDAAIRGGEPSDLVGSGWSVPSAQSEPGAAAAGAMSVEELSPSARLPETGFQLSESEIKALHLELDLEREADLPRMAVDLAVELAMLEPGREEQRAVAETLAEVLDALVADQRPAALLDSFERLSELTQRWFSSDPGAQEVYRRVLERVSGRELLDRFLVCVADRLELAGRVKRFLAALPEQAVPVMVDGLSLMRHSRLRRALSHAILVHGDRGPRLLVERLSTLRASGKNQVVDELFRMIRQLPVDPACALIERLVSSGDSGVARRSALVLGQLRGRRAREALLDLLETGGLDTRPLAIGALARTEDSSLAPRLLEKALESGEAGLDSAELSRLLPAIGRLGGDRVLPTLRLELETQSRGWMTTPEKRRRMRAFVRGIRAVGSPAARDCLLELAEGGSRQLRGVCREGLASGTPR